jgi:hypothetical protein
MHGNKWAYDLRLRPDLMVQAIQKLQAAGEERDIWKVEGPDRQDGSQKVVATARADGRYGWLHRFRPR